MREQLDEPVDRERKLEPRKAPQRAGEDGDYDRVARQIAGERRGHRCGRRALLVADGGAVHHACHPQRGAWIERTSAVGAAAATPNVAIASGRPSMAVLPKTDDMAIEGPSAIGRPSIDVVAAAAATQVSAAAPK